MAEIHILRMNAEGVIFTIGDDPEEFRRSLEGFRNEVSEKGYILSRTDRRELDVRIRIRQFVLNDATFHPNQGP